MNIEKNIPIPPKKRTTGVAGAIRAMQTGDSVVIPRINEIGWRSTARTIGVKVVARKISDTECRLWRVS